MTEIFDLPENFGAVSFSKVKPLLSPDALEKVYHAVPHPKSVLVGFFPYYAGNSRGNVAKYARSRDYHAVVGEILGSHCGHLTAQNKENRFVPFTDISPLPEVWVAAAAGLGRIGLHGLLITPRYGSYVCIGCILTDLSFPYTDRDPLPCEQCGRCVAACPGGALALHEGKKHFELAKCVSHITQKKGELSEQEQTLLKKAGRVWGCDACQDACPHNKNPQITPIAAFREGLIDSLCYEDVEGLSNKQLQNKYPERAFTWRGAEVLRRNCRITVQTNPGKD